MQVCSFLQMSQMNPLYTFSSYFFNYHINIDARGRGVVKAISYKSEGPGSEPQYDVGFTQLLSEVSTRNRKIMFLGVSAAGA
jgi:hypothetical protein